MELIIPISYVYLGVPWANTSQALNTVPGTLKNVSNDDVDNDKSIIT